MKELFTRDELVTTMREIAQREMLMLIDVRELLKKDEQGEITPADVIERLISAKQDLLNELEKYEP